MGEVWLATRQPHPGIQKVVALKLVDLGEGEVERRRFLREARLGALLTHSNIVQVFDAGLDDARAWLAMEWVDGVDLHTIMTSLREDEARCSPNLAAYIVVEILRALDYAGSRKSGGRPLGIVHRDLSPHNVLVSASGEVKVADFGVATSILDDTDDARVCGKLRYMAPEQFMGAQPDQRVDLYAVGAILHELLTGKRLRDAISLRQLERQIRSSRVPAVPRGVPGPLAVLHQALLRPNPADRPRTAEEALRMLRGIGDAHEARRMLRRACASITGRDATTVSIDAVETMPEGPVDKGCRGDEVDATPAAILAPKGVATRTYPVACQRRRSLRRSRRRARLAVVWVVALLSAVACLVQRVVVEHVRARPTAPVDVP